MSVTFIGWLYFHGQGELVTSTFWIEDHVEVVVSALKLEYEKRSVNVVRNAVIFILFLAILLCFKYVSEILVYFFANAKEYFI